MPPFLEKIFHPQLYCQVKGTQLPLSKGEDLNYTRIRIIGLIRIYKLKAS